MTKHCSQCKQDRPIEEFYRSKVSSDNHSWWCILCCKAQSKRRYIEKREHIRETVKKHYKTHFEQISKYKHEYHLKNREKIAARSKQWYLDNRDRALTKVRDLVHSRKSRAVCQVCEGPLVGESKRFCEWHYINHLATQRFRCSTKGMVEPLKQKLLAQNNRCFYSGRTLVLGKNASLDHVVPVSAGQSDPHNLSNIVWADVHVNHAKLALSKDEFVKLCQDVVSHTSQK